MVYLSMCVLGLLLHLVLTRQPQRIEQPERRLEKVVDARGP